MENFLGDEALTETAQKSCGCPIHGSAQSQAGWGFGQLKGVPAYSRGWGWVGYEGPFQDKRSCVSLKLLRDVDC